MPNLNIEVSKELLAEINYAATMAGCTQKEFVVKVLEGAINGDDEGRAEGGGGKDHGKASDDGGRKADLRDAGKEAGGVFTAERKDGGAGVRGMRGKVSGDVGAGREGGGGGVGEVLRPSSETQSGSGAMDRSALEDSIRERNRKARAEAMRGRA